MNDSPPPRRARTPQQLQERLISFAADVCVRTRLVRTDPTMAPILDQLVRAVTSPAANYGEACAAHSRRDFVHKMHICLKELRETRVFLVLLGRLDPHELALPVVECDELIAIFVTSIKTAKRSILRQDES